MNVIEFQKRLAFVSNNPDFETLTETASGVMDAFEDVAKVKCINLDKFKFIFYPDLGTTNTPCSADALTFERNGTFLIEFKANSVDGANIVRKVYDSIMLFVEHGGYDFSRTRNEIVFVLVTTAVCSSMEKAVSRSRYYMKEPWDQMKPQLDRWGISNLENIIVKKAYVMSPDMFNYYIKFNRWER